MHNTTYTFRYRSTRREVWQWYWKAWRHRFWMVHVLTATFVTVLIASDAQGSVSLADFLRVFIPVMPLTVIGMALIPQLLFKKHERILHVGPEGWRTQIGTRQGARDWREIASLQDWEGRVVITGRNGNALIIPARAFADTALRDAFMQDAQHWLRTATEDNRSGRSST